MHVLRAPHQEIQQALHAEPAHSSYARRLPKQATITRRRVLRRVVTKAGQEIVIHEAPSQDSVATTSSAADEASSAAATPPHRPGSPNPKPTRRTRSAGSFLFCNAQSCLGLESSCSRTLHKPTLASSQTFMTTDTSCETTLTEVISDQNTSQVHTSHTIQTFQVQEKF